MEKFEPIDIDIVLNSEDFKAQSEKVKTSLMQIGLTAEEAQKKIDSKLKNAFTNNALKELPNLVDKTGVSAARVQTHWNGLGNSINQISREMSAFTVSAQTGFLAISNNIPILADEIGRLSAKNKELTASGEKTVPVWKQVVKGLFSWGTALSLGVTLLTIYGKEMVTFIGNLFKGKDAFDVLKTSIAAVNKAFEGNNYQKVIKDVEELRSYINLAKEGIIDKDIALKEYNKTLGGVTGEVNDLATAEKNLVDKAPAYIEAMLYKAAAAEALSEAGRKIAENNKKIADIENEKIAIENRTQKAVAGGFNPTSSGSVNVSSLKADSDRRKADARINELKNEAEDLQKKTSKIVDDLNKKSIEIAEKAGIDIFGGGEDDPDKNKVVSDYQNLLDKLSALDKEYSRKSFTKDEEELQALKDKFSTIRTLVQRFNADPKNKAQIIDLSNLNALEKEAISTLSYRQTTDKLKEELNVQKQLYADFETYKKQFGQEAAEKEFAGKIEVASSYYDYLKLQQKENAKAYEAVDNGTATGAEIERVQLLNKALQTETTVQKKLFDEQLASLLNYQKKRALLIENYNAKRKEYLEAGKTDEVKVLEEQHLEELDNLDDANVKKLASYKALYKGIVGLTVQQIKEIIAQNEKLLETEQMSQEMREAILKKIAELKKTLKENSIDEIYAYAKGVADLGAAFAGLGESLGNKALANGGALLAGLGSSLGEVLTIFDKMGDGSFKDLSSADKSNVISAGVSGAISLVNMFTSAAAKRKAAEEEYYLSVIGFQNQYNLSLQEQIRLRSILDENAFIKDYEGRITDALASLSSANDEYQTAIDNLIAKGKAKDGLRNAIDWGNVGSGAASGAAVGAAVGSVVPVIGTAIGAIVGGLAGAIGGLFGGSKKKDTYTGILEEYPELIETSENGIQRINVALAESLIANNLVNKETEQILENILELEEALDAARAQIKEVITELSGNLSSDLKDNLVDAFESGENAAIKMGDTIEAVLENVLSTLIFNSIFSKAFDDLEQQMTDSFDIGGDGTWVDDFASFFTNANALTDDFNAAMTAAQEEAANFGFDIFKPDYGNSTGLTGSIRSELTEETGTELAGLFRGQYDITKRLYQITEEYYAREMEAQGSVLNLIKINTQIEINTRNSYEQLKLHLTELQTIAKNTKPATTTRDLGLVP